MSMTREKNLQAFISKHGVQKDRFEKVYLE